MHAALVTQGCGPRQLEVKGEWAWLLEEFAATYGIRSTYTTLAHLLWVIRQAALSSNDPPPARLITAGQVYETKEPPY
jgi:hypothetical protein